MYLPGFQIQDQLHCTYPKRYQQCKLLSESYEEDTSTEQNLMLKEACKHQSVSLASEINWLRVWEAARDRGPFWTKISQTFYKLLTKPLFEERNCHKCDSRIPDDISFSAILLKIMPPTLWTLIVSWPTSAQRTLIQTLTLSIVWDHLSLCFIPILNCLNHFSPFYYINTCVVTLYN